jgi:hypothetical protein
MSVTDFLHRLAAARQLRDVAGVLAERDDLDIAYIEHWVRELGLEDPWNVVRAGA